MVSELLLGLSGLILQLALVLAPVVVLVVALGVNDMVKP